MDGGPPIVAPAHHPSDAPAPSIIEQDLVTQPVQTEILTIDALFVLGRGQRELIIGDRGTGKTAIAVDTVINQRPSDLICICVAVGQKSSTVARIIDAIRRHGARERCSFVVAAATASPQACNGSHPSPA